MRWSWIVAAGLLLAGCAGAQQADYVPISTETLSPAVESAAQVTVLAAVPTDRAHEVIGHVSMTVAHANQAAKDALVQELRRRAWLAGGHALVNLQVESTTEWVQDRVMNPSYKEGQGQSPWIETPRQQAFFKASAMVIRFRD